ncbi:MAG: hypothetical protein PHT06_04620, partial [Dehalococcoidales bacterium]|nr:hypothetical protein [Dehalococcoidales bacterium]
YTNLILFVHLLTSHPLPHHRLQFLPSWRHFSCQIDYSYAKDAETITNRGLMEANTAAGAE